MKALAAALLLATGLAGCSTPPPPPPAYQAAPTPEPGTEYPRARTHHYSEPAS